MNVVNFTPTGIKDDNPGDYCDDNDDDAAAVIVVKRRSTCLMARRVMR